MSSPGFGGATPTVLRDAFMAHVREYRTAIYYSLVIGVLSLAAMLYMLEVYERVVNSRSMMTLTMLTLAVVGSYIMMEMLELVRHSLLSSIAMKVDKQLRERLFDITFEARLRQQGGGSVQVFNDFKTLRDFMSSSALTAMMDAPMALIFLVIVFIVSPWLGVMALIGALVQVWVAVNTESSTMPVLTKANRAAIDAQNYASGTLRNAQVIEAMGMMGNVHGKWMEKQRSFLLLQAQASDTAGTNSALSKFIQTMQGSLLLGASCWLTLKGQMLGGGGMMIVASTLGGKVLTPLVQLVAQWRMVVNARDAYQRLEGLLANFPPKEEGMSLPVPTGLLTVEGVVVAPPGSPIPILKGVSFGINPGECVVLIGPSASGKTTLARVMMGLWPANSGKVRLDGADVFTWNKTELGPHMGYLPQTVELFDGTVAENIARFGDVDRAEVERVISQVGLKETIAALPFGLDTRIGEDGAMLSGGQRQRVALARAIYGAPKLLVLDEPNSSLDEAGELALMDTLKELKAQGSTVVLITHRTSVLSAADKVLILRDGLVAAFGPRDEVLAALRNAQSRQQVEAPSVVLNSGAAA
jgi:ATP-binding cassette subfamily C exporter for protease/lipase